MILILVLSTSACAAKVYGTVYDWTTFEPVAGVTVECNSTPYQTAFAADGSYSLILDSGTYLLEARYADSRGLHHSAQEVIEIGPDGEFLIDLLPVPDLEDDQDLIADVPNIHEIQDFEPDGTKPGGTLDTIILVFASLIVIAASYLMVQKGKKKDMGSLPHDLEEVLEEIKHQGGRMNQKDLRIKFNVGEAKMSLMITDLEDRGLVKRIKRGRANVIRLV